MWKLLQTDVAIVFDAGRFWQCHPLNMEYSEYKKLEQMAMVFLGHRGDENMRNTLGEIRNLPMGPNFFYI